MPEILASSVPQKIETVVANTVMVGRVFEQGERVQKPLVERVARFVAPLAKSYWENQENTAKKPNVERESLVFVGLGLIDTAVLAAAIVTGIVTFSPWAIPGIKVGYNAIVNSYLESRVKPAQ